MSQPQASPGSYSGGMAGCGYPQTKVDQNPKSDNQVRKRRRKRKKNDK